MAIGAGFRDIELQIELSEVQNRQTRYRQLERSQQLMYQRRIQQEQDQYEQKQAIDQRDRHKEWVGAGVSRIMADPNMTDKDRRIAVFALAEQNPGVDIGGTPSGRMFLGGGVQQYSLDHYKSLGLPPEQAQQALLRKHLGAGTISDATMEKDLKTLRDAIENEDEVMEKLVQDRLDKNPRYMQIQKNIEGSLWLSRMKGGESGEGGDFETIVKGKPEQRVKGRLGTFDDRYGSQAYNLALTEALVQGGKMGLPSERITTAFNEWWDKEHKKNIGRWQTYADRSQFTPQETASEAELLGGMSDMVAPDATKRIQTPETVVKDWTTDQYGKELTNMYGDILGGPGGKQPTAAELRAENTREAYEKGKKLGYWK